MKKLYFLIVFSFLVSAIFISCNKDDAVTNPGGGSTPVAVTNTFLKSGNVPIILGETNDILTIDSSGTINSLSFALNNIENVNAANVDIFLLHSGVIDTLLYQTTNTGTNFIGTIFSDTASVSIQNGSGNFSGYFKPYRPLSIFNGLNINGQWTLKFISRVNQKSGVIKSWGITISYNKVQPQTTLVMPLAVGNYWIFERRDENGVFLRQDTFSIPYTTIFNGKTVYRWYMSTNNDSIFMGNESNGLWMYLINNNISRLMWKYPVSSGEWWIGGPNNDTIRCLSTNEIVITPIETYTGCIKYKQSDRYNSLPVTAHAYCKPGLGFVAYELYDINLNLQERWKIVAYNLNK
jgi:subtilisin-like proprotein convertase family protein